MELGKISQNKYKFKSANGAFLTKRKNETDGTLTQPLLFEKKHETINFEK